MFIWIQDEIHIPPPHLTLGGGGQLFLYLSMRWGVGVSQLWNQPGDLEPQQLPTSSLQPHSNLQHGTSGFSSPSPVKQQLLQRWQLQLSLSCCHHCCYWDKLGPEQLCALCPKLKWGWSQRISVCGGEGDRRGSGTEVIRKAGGRRD